MGIPVGLKCRAEDAVTKENTAEAVGSGNLPVYATPAMLALMEAAAYKSLLPYLDEGQTSVGVALNVTHEAATPVGMAVWAESEVTAVDGRKVSFTVCAYDKAGLIGQGSHERVVITAERFMDKVSKRK